jgi:PAS domain S-box-containing protein
MNDSGKQCISIEELIDSVIILDREGRIKEINRAALDLLAYDKKALLNKPMRKVCKDFSLAGIIEKIPIRDYEMIYRNKRNDKIPMSVNVSAAKTREGLMTDVILVARDIRKIKELIRELTESSGELEKSYAVLRDKKDELVKSEKLAFTGRIAANIAHEIRNPLTNVAMSVRALEKSLKPGDTASRYIEVIVRNTERINFLITELLNCARPSKLDLRLHDPHRILHSALESIRPKIKSQNIQVVKKFTARPLKISVDREYIERVFLNIIKNAVEAMPRGGKLAISTESSDESFMARIQDTGRGIPENDIIKLFDPFFSTKKEGVGLGLTVCYGIIVSHGGTIEVESKPRKGAIFTISLPRFREVEPE